MKTSIVFALLFSLPSISLFAQHDRSGHQQPATAANTQRETPDSSRQKQLVQLLSSYYDVKNALVTGDAASASAHASAFLKKVNAIDYQVISEGNIHILATEAGRIEETKDLQKQRDYFANFSSNVAAVAKALKIGDQPVYLQYCPMKKATWLSAEKEIKNPYYGSAMRSCGEVKETW